MKVIVKYSGGRALCQGKGGKLFVRVPYRGSYEVWPGDRIWTPLGFVTVPEVAKEGVPS